MALMPPTAAQLRRSSRLSSTNNEYENENENEVRASSSRETLQTSGHRVRAEQHATTTRRERRFEEIESDEEGEDAEENGDSADFLTGFTRPTISGNAKYAASIPAPRQARTTLHEEAGDDGFIFSAAAGPSSGPAAAEAAASKAVVPGARGPPPPTRTTSTQRQGGFDRDRSESHATTTQKGDGRNAATMRERRMSSGTVKAVRRVSYLRDGTTAHPHPNIADADLFRHCSSELSPHERLRHLTNWTLERSVKKALSRFKGSSNARFALQTAVESTITSLSRGELTLQWPGQTERQRSDQKLRPHPRNDANRKTERSLRETIDVMQQEVDQWQEAKEELRLLEEEIRTIEGRSEAIRDGRVDTEHISSLRLLFEDSRDQPDGNVYSRIRSVLIQQAPWLQGRKMPDDNYENDDDEITRLAIELYAQEHHEPPPVVRTAKRRRTTLGRGSEDIPASDVDAAPRPHSPLQGSEADSRWENVEWNADRIRASAHTLSQLGELANRYTAAISARGAQAIGELVNVGSQHAARSSSSSTSDSTTDPSRVARENQQTLQRILSGIRKLQQSDSSAVPTTERDDKIDSAASHPSSAGPSHAVPGDISEGDILRAFAGMSGRRK